MKRDGAHDKGGGVDLRALDLGYLALFVGQQINARVLEALHEAGYAGLRHAHGYVFQHLLDAPRKVTELSALLEVSQQAASKSVKELVALGYLEDVPAPDARVRRVALSAKGRGAVEMSRALRGRLSDELTARHGGEVARARALLARVLEELGGAGAVTGRRVRPPA